MNKLPLLIKREYWEHRGGFLWTPFWLAGAILILTVLGIASAEVFGSRTHVSVGISLDQLRGQISADEIAKAANGLDMAQVVFSGIVSVGVFFVTFFYLLGALYDDRRDRSVLFWKSLPISDTATVAAKAITAMLLVPAIALAVSTLAYVAFLIIVCAWAALHGINAAPAVLAAHPVGMFMRLLAILPASALWSLPAIGWLLFWSAFARSKPFLWAVLLPCVVLIANWWIGLLGGPHLSRDLPLASMLGRLLFSIMPGSWMSSPAVNLGGAVTGVNLSFDVDDHHVLSSFDPAHIYGLLATPNLWIGVLAGVALLVGATWFRSRRIETVV